MSTPLAVTPTRSTRPVLVGLVAVVLLVSGVLVSSVSGQLDIHTTQVIGSMLQRIGFDTAWAPADPVIDATLWVVH